VLQHLSSEYKAMGSNPSTENNKKNHPIFFKSMKNTKEILINNIYPGS
jgi:hypothetical protein